MYPRLVLKACGNEISSIFETGVLCPELLLQGMGLANLNSRVSDHCLKPLTSASLAQETVWEGQLA